MGFISKLLFVSVGTVVGVAVFDEQIRGYCGKLKTQKEKELYENRRNLTDDEIKNKERLVRHLDEIAQSKSILSLAYEGHVKPIVDKFTPKQ